MKSLQQFLNFFIPEPIRQSPILYRKGVLLTAFHLLLLCSISFMFFLNIQLPQDSSNLEEIAGLPAVIISIFVFKKWGSLILSGNVFAFFWFVILAPIVPVTGGLYSDNIIWMIIGPVSSLILTTRAWGTFWMLLLMAFFTCIYFYGLSHPELNAIKFAPSYYYTSYMLVSSFIFIIFVVFKTGQSLIIEQLDDKNNILSEQKQAIAEQSQELEKIGEKLRESNNELQTFAYSASHDLKEPLRMIGMYTQLLKQRMGDRMSEREEEYMFFVTDGVQRMQQLLDDLLEFSRLGKNLEDTKEIDLNDILSIVKHNLTVRIDETNATINIQKLPFVVASSTEMSRLFQNIIANAIKFRKKGLAPVIDIQYEIDNETHLFCIKDNGIGIKKDYQEAVFNIFQRLHSRNEYDGTGIGLATCRKIVESLGGKIWLTSEEGVGTNFHFTIPMQSKLDMSQTELNDVVEKQEMVLA